MFDLAKAALSYLTTQLAFMQPTVTYPASHTLRIMTFNVRFDGSPAPPIPSLHNIDVLDGLPQSPWGEKRWSERRFKVADTIALYDPDVFGLQEVLVNQMGDLQQLVGSVYDHVGVGRDDGNTAGEYVPIFYKKERFRRLAINHFWLSDTPSKPGSIGWDATRMVTIVSLLDSTHPGNNETSGSGVVHIANTHYDDRGKVARAQSSILIRQLLPGIIRRVEDEHGIVDRKKSLAVLLGDLNSPEDEDGYREMTSLSSSTLIFRDARYALALAPVDGRLWAPFGHANTYTGFFPYDPQTRIDFIFLGSLGETDWKVQKYAVLENMFEGGNQGEWTGLSSDHRPVYVEVYIR